MFNVKAERLYSSFRTYYSVPPKRDVDIRTASKCKMIDILMREDLLKINVISLKNSYILNLIPLCFKALWSYNLNINAKLLTILLQRNKRSQYSRGDSWLSFWFSYHEEDSKDIKGSISPKNSCYLTKQKSLKLLFHPVCNLVSSEFPLWKMEQL